jgi:hypothetical protein
VLVVWSDDLDGIIPLCHEFENNLIKLVWSHRNSLTSFTPETSLPATSAAPSSANLASDVDLNEKVQETEGTPETEQKATPKSGGSLWGWRIGSKAKQAPAPNDLEKGGASARPTRYFGPVYGGLTLALSLCEFVLHLSGPVSSC